MSTKPTVVCLCGSSRFKDAFVEANRNETLAGRIVLSIGMFGHHEGLDMDGPVKQMLDDLHKRKIDLADEVLVLNPKRAWCLNHERWTDPLDGEYCCVNVEQRPYIGPSTRSEIEYAQTHGKPIRYLEPIV